MTAEELIKMYAEMRKIDGKNWLSRRADLSDIVYILRKGLLAIGNHEELAQMLWTLYNELESVDSCELASLVKNEFWKE